MRNNIKNGALVIAFLLIFLVSVSALAATDKETNAANQLKAISILKGKDNGDLALDSNITRAEMATLILRVTLYEEEEVPGSNDIKYTDINGHWAEENIKKTIKLGYMKGYSDTIFAPDDLISYAEVVTLMIRLLGVEGSIGSEEWPIGHINKAKELKLIKDETIYSEDRYSEKLRRGTVSLLLWDTIISNTNIE